MSQEQPKYKIIHGHRYPDVEKQVERHLAEGWLLVGGVSLAVNYAGDELLAQAMILREEVGE